MFKALCLDIVSIYPSIHPSNFCLLSDGHFTYLLIIHCILLFQIPWYAVDPLYFQILYLWINLHAKIYLQPPNSVLVAFCGHLQIFRVAENLSLLMCTFFWTRGRLAFFLVLAFTLCISVLFMVCLVPGCLHFCVFLLILLFKIECRSRLIHGADFECPSTRKYVVKPAAFRHE